jgi:hypothetical protein
VNEAAAGAGEIAANVVGVARAAQDTTAGAAAARAAAQELAGLAEELNLTVSRFVVDGSARLRRTPSVAVPTGAGGLQRVAFGSGGSGGNGGT